MFGTFFILAFAGFVSFLFLSLAKFDRKTPKLSGAETFKAYFEKDGNMWGSAASFIMIIVMSFLLTVPGKEWFVGKFTGGQVPADTPFGIYLTAFLLGLGIQGLATLLSGLIVRDPMQYKTDDSKTDGQ